MLRLATFLWFIFKGVSNMAKAESKVPVKTEETERAPALQSWRPFESLRREVDRIFEDFDRDLWRFPLRRTTEAEPYMMREFAWRTPAVDIVDKGNAFEITAELPGMDEKDIEVKLSNGSLMIRGEKREEKEEKRKNYYLHERHFGSFERNFPVPEGIDPERIEANFKKGILSVTLPKKPEAIKPERKIEVKAS
jgi:HSP20 family protein